MTKQRQAARLLVQLYRAASRGRFLTEACLSEMEGISPQTVAHLLAALDREGFVDAKHLRLTLRGLTVAVAAARQTRIKALANAA